MLREWRPGGHYQVTHLDVGSLLWLEDKGFSRLYDIGAGPGGMVRLARSMGWRAWGYDADRSICDGDVVRYLRIGADEQALRGVAQAADAVVWSIEVAEHIAVEAVDAYVELLTGTGNTYICMTANPHPGPWHCNPQPAQYWIDRITAVEHWRYSPALTEEWQAASTMRREFIQRTGMCFVRVEQ